ncbi:hypothetical protein E1176_07300 [Fulvivirga sp. RKSG066]|uniref:BatA domain-containing protein n=1 Tax=Fulvivirga aurantia TaxID=2529383 RepID=UPI0012BC8485|nr:BatA domain-containing protein [Fulvivirga aurantia]MTI20821.1 hypothetical protein [Fulvivirga aurantia]
MNFLYPQFLFGLFALAIPIIVHLFNFRRTRKVYFSNTQFLQKVKEASSSKLRLKHYLILLSRLLFIFFLVMAFAQPILIAEDDTGLNQNDVLIYLDNSYSMSNEVGEGITAFDAGVSYVNELVNLFPAATNYRLLTNDFNTAAMLPKSKTELSDLSTELSYSSVTRSMSDINDRIQSQSESQTIFWISDFQKSTSDEAVITVDSSKSQNLVPLEFTSTKNVAVDSVWLNNPFLIGDEKLQLNVKVRNYGRESVDDLIVKVFVDEVQSATSSINLSPNTSMTTTFDLAFELNGINKCKVAFEEFPVTFDNEFFFTINGSRKINVLEIKNTDAATNVTRVYGNEELFNLTSVNVANLDYSLISQNDLVIINGISQIDQSLVNVVNEYLGLYGNVLLVSGATPDLSSYRSLRGLQNVSLRDSLLSVDLSTPDFDNPFFENVFEEKSRNMVMPSAKKVIDWGRDRTAILSLQNGDPFLSKLNTTGNFYVMASPLQDGYTSLYSHALFVPVMYRMAVASASADNKLYYFTDQPIITFKTDTTLADQVYRLKSDLGEIIPSQRITGNTVYMEVPKNVLNTGFYDLMLGDNVINTLAFNKSFDESDLEQYTSEEVRNKFQGDITIFAVDDQQAFAGEVKGKYVGQSLWKYAILLALLFLLAEVLLIRFFP